MRRRRRARFGGYVRGICLDVFLALWVGGMLWRAGGVLLAPLGRFVDALAVTFTTALLRR